MTEAAESDRSTERIDAIVRSEWGRVLATLVAEFADFELAEDVLQEALLTALQRWPADGFPVRPAAWLLTVARRRAIDRLRRARTHAENEAALVLLADRASADAAVEADNVIRDDRLRLIFTCCHPALRQSAQVALTLKALCGLKTVEIARAFLTAETTMAQRIVRAKRKIKSAGIPYRVPTPEQFPDRLQSVLTVIYLIFTEGYMATEGDNVVRQRLCDEAERLSRLLCALLPQSPEALGLLALVLLHGARSAARSDTDGALMTLEQQDRRRWNCNMIDEGNRVLRHAEAMAAPGPYQLQAAISRVHVNTACFAATDWREIRRLYDALYRLQPTPVVRLNGIVAQFLAGDEAAAIDGLEALERAGELADYAPFHAARSDLNRRRGHWEIAFFAGERALALTKNDAERRFLERRLESIAQRLPARDAPR